MFWKLSSRLLLIGALAAVAAPTLAAVELVGAAPSSTSNDGLQADYSAPPLVQTGTSSVAGTIESIVWWGYHGTDSNGASFDNFLVTFNGADQTGDLDVKTDSSSGLSRYELDIADTPLVAGRFALGIVNDSEDVEWYWQCDDRGSCDGENRGGLAYALMGTRDTVVPEPQSLALALLGLVAVGAAGRRRRSSR